jgi:ribosomal protein L6P/L9E
MSRIGKQPIPVPSGVDVTINVRSVKGINFAGGTSTFTALLALIFVRSLAIPDSAWQPIT